MAVYSISAPPELMQKVDEEVDDSNVYENRSHYIRSALREYMEEESEFSPTK